MIDILFIIVEILIQSVDKMSTVQFHNEKNYRRGTSCHLPVEKKPPLGRDGSSRKRSATDGASSVKQCSGQRFENQTSA